MDMRYERENLLNFKKIFITGYVCGPAGSTTSYRMDPYVPALLEQGLKGMIGKGLRSKEVVVSMKKNNKAVYFVAVGGAVTWH